MTGLADQISLSGIEVAVFADHVRSKGVADIVRPYPIFRYGSFRPLRRFLKRRAIGRAARDGNLSALFADSWKSVAALPTIDAPVAILAHGTEFPSDASPSKARRINAALKRAGVIIASSEYTAGLVADFMHGVGAPIIVVNPPIAELPVASATALAEIDAIIAGRGPVLTTLARLEPRKGIDAVLRALPTLRERHPGLVYLIAGGGGDLVRLRALTAQLRVDERVVFLGPLNEIDKKAALLIRSDVYAMPSRRIGNSVEGFGISYVEAAWYGVPSLAGADGGAADAVVNNLTGLVCNGADHDAVRDALGRLLDDEALRKQLGAAAAQRARATRTWSAALPRYLAAVGR